MAALVVVAVALAALLWIVLTPAPARAEGNCTTVADLQLREYLLHNRVHRAEVIQR